MAKRVIHGFARGHEGAWEAICPELDIAVQGRSCEEVKTLLETAVQSYIKDALQEAPRDAYRLMHRRSPLWLRIRLHVDFAFYSFFHPQNGQRADFDLLCHA